jgi:DNA-binding beta-propeller fold protein YncE
MVIHWRGLGVDPPAARRVGRAVLVITIVSIAVAVVVGLAGLAAGLLAIGAGVKAGVDAVGDAVEETSGLARQVQAFGEPGIGPGAFTDARAIGVDSSGTLYVGEYQGGRVQVFDSTGEFVTQWFADREFPLTGMAVGRDGPVYTVQRGEIVARDGASGERLGALVYDQGSHFEDVAVYPDGGLVTSWYGNRDDIVVFDARGEWLSTIAEAVSGQTGDSELSLRVAVTGQGDILALGEFNGSVFHFGPDGSFRNRFGAEGNQAGQFTAPMSIAVDGQGRVFVGDISGVQVFDLDGRYLETIAVEGVPFGLAIGDEGDLWVVNGTRVMEYAIEGP